MESLRVEGTGIYPLQLHCIKALLLQRQYRQCIKTCQQALDQDGLEDSTAPLRRTFAQFYLALAHDELARGMHTFSQAKVLAFNQAEQFYREALTSLPNAEDCIPSTEAPKPDSRHDTPSEQTSSNSLNTLGHCRSRSDLGAIRISPLTHIRNDSLPMRSPMTSPGMTESEIDDLESHDSFNQIMTPTRLPKLHRDYSSMSLLQTPHPRVPHGLMKPVRPGSTAKPYFPPPSRSQTVPSRTSRHSMLPRIDTSSPTSEAVRKQLRTVSEQASPVDLSPVSPLGSEGDTVESDASTISPISPETPLEDLEWSSSREIQQLRLIDDHLQGMRNQLQGHIKLLKEAKQRILDSQTERLSARLNSPKASRMNPVVGAAASKGGSLQQSRSYWSFMPEDQKVLEKQRRVQAGRDRGWMRARFDPTRYTLLADAALAEL